MSNRFTYQIDEKVLRSRLRAVTIPSNNDAWPWFELHAGLEKPLPVKRMMSFRIKLPLEKLKIDGKLLTSVACAIGILTGAFALVSFLDFKDPVAKATESKPMAVTPVAEKPLISTSAPQSSNLNEDVSLRLTDIRLSQPEAASKVQSLIPATQPRSRQLAKSAAQKEPVITEQMPLIQPMTLPVEDEVELR
jgi:hypothetical protein